MQPETESSPGDAERGDAREILEFIDGSEPGLLRRRFEEHVAAGYARAYGARIDEFLPRLFALIDERFDVGGVIGARGAGESPLFLERYLDQPIERVLSGRTGSAVARHGLFEVGNLTAARPGLGRLLVALLASWLDGYCGEWAVFTGTRALLNLFRHMGVPVVDLGPADGLRLGGDLAKWGTYYDTGPRVSAARVGDVLSAARVDRRVSRHGALLERVRRAGLREGCIRAGAA